MKVYKSDKQDASFYAIMGSNFASLDIAKELEQQVYNKPRTTWYVHIVNDCAVAFVSVCEQKNNHFVDNLFVHYGWRGKGLARELIEAVVANHTDKPLKCIACNPYALKLFDSFGFEKVGVNGKYTKLLKH